MFLRGSVLEDEGFTRAECCRMEYFSGAVCWRMNGSQGQSAGG